MLPDFDAPQPAGGYRVDHNEESIEGASWFAWRRVGSFINLPGIGMLAARQEVVPINPADLAAAIEQDRKKKDHSSHDPSEHFST